MVFPVTTPTGVIAPSELSVNPSLVDGKVINQPEPQEGVLWLVNALIFNNSERHDFVMFDPEKTVRDSDGRVVAQGGFLTKSGESFDF